MTLEPIPYAQGAVPVVLGDDRRGWLIAFGVVNLIAGALAGCMSVGTFAAIGAVAYFQARGAGGAGGPNPIPGIGAAELIAGVTYYVLAAVLFVWSGVDSIRCRRWVRPVLVAAAWIAIVTSTFYLLFTAVAYKDIERAMAIQQTSVAPPPAATTAPTTGATTGPAVNVSIGPGPAAAMLWSMMCGAGLLGIALPGAYAWFYSRPSVRRTLEAYDPRPSWTERVPLPLFVAATGLVFGALTVATSAPYATAPFFGHYLRGAPAVALTLASAGTMLLAAILLFRQEAAGWWVAMSVILLGFLSVLATLWAVGPLEFYRINHVGRDELNVWRDSTLMTGPMPLIFTGAVGAACIGYLLWVRRYVRPPIDTSCPTTA